MIALCNNRVMASSARRETGRMTGAVRYRPQVRRRPGLIRRVMLFGTVLTLCIAGLLKLQPQWQQLMDRPVASVIVEGEFKFVSRETIVNHVEPQLQQGFLQLSLQALKLQLQKMPWVDSVAVGRRWPDQLVINVSEHRAIARWGDQAILNQRGEVVTIGSHESVMSLPLLSGDLSQSELILQRYQDLSKLLRKRHLEIAELHRDASRAWRLRLLPDMQIEIGRGQVMEKMQRFVQVYDRVLASKQTQIEGVDIRYKNGLAVRWRAAVAERASVSQIKSV